MADAGQRCKANAWARSVIGTELAHLLSPFVVLLRAFSLAHDLWPEAFLLYNLCLRGSPAVVPTKCAFQVKAEP